MTARYQVDLWFISVLVTRLVKWYHAYYLILIQFLSFFFLVNAVSSS